MQSPLLLLQQWLNQYNETLAHWQAQGNILTPAIARESMATMTGAFVTDIQEMSFARDETIHNGDHLVPVRIYHPDQSSSLKAAVFFHGGGHMSGSVEVYDLICRKIARSANRVVIAVEYRLAPEHPYPAGIEDGAAVVDGCLGLLERLDVGHLPRLALIGDSAGGAMSATLAHRFQNAGEPEIDKLVLIYPSLDYSLSSPSTDRFGSGYLLEKEKIEWYFDNYFSKNEARIEASPLFMEITESFPETMVITAGLCPLCDEGGRYVQRLKEHGIRTRHIHFEELLHAFLNLENLVPDQCRTCYHELGEFLRSPDPC